MSFNVTKYQDLLKKIFKDSYEQFNQTLIDSEALIAGSSVLSVYQKFNSYNIDLDIYVHMSKVEKFVNFLINTAQFSILNSRNYITPEYDQSFFKKNNILSRFRMFKESEEYDEDFIDILIISDDHPIENIVKNFDLSICEIWYDGRTVQGTDPEGIENKIATLRKEYLPALLQHNEFTIKRIKKYKRRGFAIKVNPECIPEPILIKKHKKSITDPENWVFLKIYKNILFAELYDNSIIYDYFTNDVLENIDFQNNIEKKTTGNIRFNLFVKYPILNYTIENLNKLVDKLLGITDFSEGNKKYIRKQFYVQVLADYNSGYIYFSETYKNYIKDYLNIREKDVKKYKRSMRILNNREDEYDEYDEYDEDNEDENENTEIDMNQYFIEFYDRVTRNREERNRSIIESRERERRIYEEEMEKKEKENLLNEVRNDILKYSPENEVMLEIIEYPTHYKNSEIIREISIYYQDLLKELISTDNLNINESEYTDLLEVNEEDDEKDLKKNIKLIKKFLQYYYQRKYYYEKIRNIIQDLEERNPGSLNIEEFRILISSDISNTKLKKKIEKYYSQQNLIQTVGPEDENETETPINFEGINYDESRLKTTCQDLIMFDEKEITEHLNEEGAVILINRGSGSESDSDILCFDRETLSTFYNDKNDGWFYPCTGNLMWNRKNDRFGTIELSNDRSAGEIFRKPYVKLPVNMEGMNAFISARELYSMIHSSKNIFYIEPKVDIHGTQISFTHTITWKNVYGEPSWVSANHCQSGSNILVYEIKVCNNPETCIRSILN